MSTRMEGFGFWLSKTFASTRSRGSTWPYIAGRYFVHDRSAPVAVTTLGSVDLAGEVSDARPDRLCIVGRTQTENIGVEKVVKNIIANPAIRFLLMVGREPAKHCTGATFKALFENGLDDSGHIPGSPGMRPLLPNTTPEEVARLRDQVELVNMIDCLDTKAIGKAISELAARSPGVYSPRTALPDTGETIVPLIEATHHDPAQIRLDGTGYFVILPEEDVLLVEHYDYQNCLLRQIRGDSPRDLYLTIVDNGWVGSLDHACYLGKELARADLARRQGIEFVQDGA